jgi:hypothetical protein
MSREITVRDVGHVYAADPGDLWFAGRVSRGPRRVVGRRAAVHLTEEAAVRLASELLAVVSARQARRFGCRSEVER